MITTPLALADSLRIGSVDFVSPDEIKAIIDIEAPSEVALNAGSPRPFPRINSYVLIPNENGFLVAQIEWLTVERSQYPKRKGIQDFGVIDLPFPLRKMSLNPLGVLKEENIYGSQEKKYTFTRGVEIFPTIGDPILLPFHAQLTAIVESGEHKRVKIGVSPLAGNADVSIDPDRLFGRHLAILGNTGSGKSCSVAGVVRWSIEAAKRDKSIESINSRFIILDPNGEYSNAFSDMSNVRLFAVEPNETKGIKQLQIPLWFWNSAEWCAFAQASSKTQRPTLIQALRSVRDGDLNFELTPSHDMRRFLRTVTTIVTIERNQGNPWNTFPKNKAFFEKVLRWQGEFNTNDAFSSEENLTINALKFNVDTLLKNRNTQYGPYDFTRSEIEALLKALHAAHSIFGGSDKDILPIDADIPRPFTGANFLRSIEATAEIMETTQHIETMLMRIRTLLSDTRLKTITNCDPALTLQKWLDDYICPSNSTEGNIVVVDLSLVPAEVIHIVTAVIARMTLEALQRYRRLNNGKTLPTTLIMEEAHTFIKKYANDADDLASYAMCSQVFEKIAREGRKFGLGLVLSSQRPSELSQTVLSQCNTFLLHRISNDRDQELVNKLVPDNLRGLLRELPSLPSQKAILLGWASELPVMVQMNYLKEEHRPRSNDPAYWNTWTASTEDEKRGVDWSTVARSWQEYNTDSSVDDPELENGK